MEPHRVNGQAEHSYKVSPWCNSPWKRTFDLLSAIFLLLLFLPLMLVVALVARDMSFVGPRPQPTRLWQQPAIQEAASCVLSVRPGITSQATLNFRHEEELLAPLSSEEVEDVYMRAIMPLKLEMEMDYFESAGFFSDLRIILRTTLRVFKRREDNDLLKQHLPAAEKKEYLRIAEQTD